MFEKFKNMRSHHQLLFALLIFFGVLNVWRGLWGLLNKYLLPQHVELSLWISLIVGLAILTSTHYTTKELM